MENQVEHLESMLEHFDNAMLITHSQSSQLRARPMSIAGRQEGYELYFVTSRSSAKLDEVKEDNRVCVTMQEKHRFLSLSGVIAPLQDQGLIDELWSSSWKIWFPDGPSDPDIMLLKFTPDTAEYWDLTGGNQLRFIYEAGKAILKGEKLDETKLDNEKVSLS